jgi:hypothetical protein
LVRVVAFWRREGKRREGGVTYLYTIHNGTCTLGACRSFGFSLGTYMDILVFVSMDMGSYVEEMDYLL